MSAKVTTNARTSWHHFAAMPLRPWRFFCCSALTCLVLNVLNAQNLVTNPGFENGTDGWFGNGLITTSVNPYSGSASGSASAAPFGTLCGQNMLGKLQAGQTYSWSAYLRASGGSSTISMNINLTDSAGSRSTLVSKAITTTWGLYSTTFSLMVTGALSDLSVTFQSQSVSAPITVFLDNVSITNSSPMLDLVPTNRSVFLSWPRTATNYTLQTATNIFASNWATVTDTVQSNVSRFWLTLPATNPAKFFRLQHP